MSPTISSPEELLDPPPLLRYPEPDERELDELEPLERELDELDERDPPLND